MLIILIFYADCLILSYTHVLRLVHLLCENLKFFNTYKICLLTQFEKAESGLLTVTFSVLHADASRDVHLMFIFKVRGGLSCFLFSINCTFSYKSHSTNSYVIGTSYFHEIWKLFHGVFNTLRGKITLICSA